MESATNHVSPKARERPAHDSLSPLLRAMISQAASATVDIHNAQPEYVIVPRGYEAGLLQAHLADVQACQQEAARQIALMRRQFQKDLSRSELELAEERDNVRQLKKEIYALRSKTVVYRLQLASADESLQSLGSNLQEYEAVVKGLHEERENLLLCNKDLHEQVQSLTTLCQGQHRARVWHQGKLATTNAEAMQLQDQLSESHALSELLSQQLSDARSALDAMRSQMNGLQAQLRQEQEESQRWQSEGAVMRAECSQIREALAQEKEAHASAVARSDKHSKELALREAELAVAEQRLQRHIQHVSQRDELLVHQVKTSEALVRQQLEQTVANLTQQLQDSRQEMRQLHSKVSEAGRARLAAETDWQQQMEAAASSHTAALARLHKQLSEQESELLGLKAKLPALDRLRVQMAEKEDELGMLQAKLVAAEKLRRQLRDQETELELLRDKVATSEKKAEIHAAEIAKLEADLERNKQNIGKLASSKDAAVTVLQEQLEQLRRRLEDKEALIRDTEAAHLRQMEHLKKRLSEHTTAADEQEALLQQQVEVAKQKAAKACDDEALSQQRLVELEALLKARDERIQKLEEARATDLEQRDRRARLLQQRHDAEVEQLEGRLRQLEQQLAAAPSPMEPTRQQVRSAAAAVDKLMGNLLVGSVGPSGLALGGIDDDDDDHGPSPGLIIGMSQPLRAGGASGAPVAQELAPEAKPPERLQELPSQTEAGLSNAVDTVVGFGSTAAGTRAQEQADDVKEQPAGKRRKAQGSDDAARGAAAPPVDPPAAAERAQEDGELNPSRGGRASTRRRAAQSAARATAQAATLAQESEAEPQIESPSYSMRTTRAAARAATKKGKGAPTAEVKGKDVSDKEAQSAEPATSSKEAAKPPGAKRRGRLPKKTSSQPNDTDAAQRQPGRSEPVKQAEVAAAGQPVQDADARAMPPPPQPAAKIGPPPASQEDGGDPPEPLSQNPSQPATQPQPAMPLPKAQPASQPAQPLAPPRHPSADIMSSVGVVPVGPVGVLATAPASSQVSIFSAQGLKPYEPLMAKNPLAAINHRVIEQAKSRVRLVPYTALQQLKPMSNVLPPSMAKHQAAAQKSGAVKRPLPDVKLQGSDPSAAGAEAVPNDVLLRSLQPPPSKVGRTGH